MYLLLLFTFLIAVLLSCGIWILLAYYQNKKKQTGKTKKNGDDILSSPLLDGFQMPAEWNEHEGCWMVWPVREDVWRDGAKPAQRVFAEIACAIAQFEPVFMCVPPQAMPGAVALLGPCAGVTLLEMESDDAWARDTGPLFLVKSMAKGSSIKTDKELRGVDFEFNSWGGLNGGCFYPWDKDNKVASHILKLAGAGRYKSSMVLEGGSVHVDGEGTLLTTRECLLNPNRNPHMTQQDIELELRNYLGIEKVIWLDKGCFNDDDTNGHIDNFACFVKPGHIALHWTDDPEDPQYPISNAALDLLQNSTDARGRCLTIHKVPLPGPLFFSGEETEGILKTTEAVERKTGVRLPASYINFYLPNGGVIMPGFGDCEQDQRAKDLFQELFPARKVVQIQSREILLGGGNIHCITQQQPCCDL